MGSLKIDSTIRVEWVLGFIVGGVIWSITLLSRVEAIVTRLDNLDKTLQANQTSQETTRTQVTSLQVDIDYTKARLTRLEHP